MLVTGVRLMTFEIPFAKPYVTSRGAESTRQLLIVRLQTDGGAIGLGEASVVPGESTPFAEVLEAALMLAAGAIGRTVGSLTAWAPPPEFPPAAVLAAESAFDVAEFDATARAQARPVAELLVAEPARSVAVNALIAAATREGAEAEARTATEQGFATVKLKVGARTLGEECRFVAGVRQAAGDDALLRLDANGAWDEETAVKTIRALAEFEIELVEQPVPPGDIEALKRVRESVTVPIAADEAIVDYASAMRIIGSGAVDAVVLKPLKLGGIGRCLTFVTAATSEGVDVIVTTSIDAGVGTAAALHLAASLPPGAPAAGLATSSYLKTRLTSPAPAVERGRMRVPQTPGLGVDLDPEEVALHCTGTSDFS